jgi:hypothetical protein
VVVATPLDNQTPRHYATALRLRAPVDGFE